MSRAPAGMDYFADPDAEAGILFEDFITALQVWSWMRPSETPATVREAAQQFGVTDAVIQNAVRSSAWMALEGPNDDPTKQVIEHDGA